VAGPDDICSPIQSETTSHCFEDRIIQRDQLALHQISKDGFRQTTLLANKADRKRE